MEAAVSAAIVPVRLGLSPFWGEGEDEGFLDVEAANRHSGSESAAVWIVRREASLKVVRLAPDQLVVRERSDFARFD